MKKQGKSGRRMLAFEPQCSLGFREEVDAQQG